MQKHFFFLLYFISVLSFSQNQIQTEVSGFYINESTKKPIGFTSFIIKYPILKKVNIDLNSGMQFIGATTGIRGGYFAFGYFCESIFFPKKKLNFGLNLGLLAGGGASAPDKDGWLIHSSLFAQYRFRNNFTIKTGFTYNHVSSSIIKGYSPLIGISWDFTLQNKDSLAINKKFNWQSIFTEMAYGKEGQKSLAFVGVGSSWKIGKFIGGDASIHAIANTYGGYMQVLSSIGPSLTCRKINFNPGFVLGLGGGGGAKTGGGALIGYQLGVNYLSKIKIGLKFQQIKAVEGVFHYNALFFSIGKEINNNSKNSVKWYPLIKAYGTSNGFGNLGARFIALDSKYIRLMGSTYWAFTHDKGAYAEGLFELSVHPFKRIPIYSVLSVGTGAGAGINKKTESIIYAASLGIQSPWKKIPFAMEFGVWKGGNIPNYSISLTFTPKFLQQN